MLFRIALLAAAAVLAALPSSAGASSVSATVSCFAEGRFCSSSVSFSGGAGEANDVTYETTQSGGYRFRDDAFAITLGDPDRVCKRVDPNEVTCAAVSGPSGGGSTLSIGLGDGDDRFVAKSPVTVDAGSGSDRIEGARISYAARMSPVTVDLAGGTGGEPGENDLLAGVTGVTGGSGADVLRGSDAVDSLWGGPGNDTIEGRGGNDALSGDDGADTVDGGAGNDKIGAQDPSRGQPRADSITCGEGADWVGEEFGLSRFVDPEDVLALDCELARLPSINDVVPRAKVTNGKLVIRVPGDDCGCRGEIAVRTPSGTTLASGRTKGARHKLTVALNRSGRRLFAKPGPHTVRIVYRAGGERGGFTTTVGGLGG